MNDIPEAWKLAFALDQVAIDLGWTPIFRSTASDVVTVTYSKNEDTIPQRLNDLDAL